MNKKLLVAAVGAAFVAAPMLAANAETTVFGHMHMSLDQADNDATNAESAGYLSSNSSRVGVKGNEDLGGGLKAIYQFELPFNADTNGTLSNTRSSWAGLAGGFGAVKLGKHDSPMKSLGRAVELFNERVGDSRNIYASSGSLGGLTEGSFLNNVAIYESPTFAGIKVALAQTWGENAGTTTNATQTAGSVVWSQGGLMAGVAYASAHTSTSNNDEETTLVAARYNGLGPVDVMAMWRKMESLNNVQNADRDAWGIGAQFNINAKNAVKAQYYQIDKADNAATDNGANMWVLGYDHIFSKTTRVYVAYAQTSNDTAGSFVPVGAGHGAIFTTSGNLPTSAGASPTVYSAGIEINF